MEILIMIGWVIAFLFMYLLFKHFVWRKLRTNFIIWFIGLKVKRMAKKYKGTKEGDDLEELAQGMDEFRDNNKIL